MERQQKIVDEEPLLGFPADRGFEDMSITDFLGAPSFDSLGSAIDRLLQLFAILLL
jgi:hypothetical protein